MSISLRKVSAALAAGRRVSIRCNFRLPTNICDADCSEGDIGEAHRSAPYNGIAGRESLLCTTRISPILCTQRGRYWMRNRGRDWKRIDRGWRNAVLL